MLHLDFGSGLQGAFVLQAMPEQKQDGQSQLDDSEAFIRRMASDAQHKRQSSEPQSFSAEDAAVAEAARQQVQHTVSHTMDHATPSEAEVDVYNAQIIPSTARERKRMLAEEVLRFRYVEFSLLLSHLQCGSAKAALQLHAVFSHLRCTAVRLKKCKCKLSTSEYPTMA